MNSILIIGSSNTDMVIKADIFPLPGETILGGMFFMFPGGKGANQAVAAARLGGRVTLIAKVGNDIFGQQALQQFTNEHINASLVITDTKNPSGAALITVDAKGENTIVVAQGANGALTSDDLANADGAFNEASILLMQLEIPIQTVLFAAQKGNKAGKKVILNPAPAASIPAELFKELYLITPNESETKALTGIAVTNIETAELAAKELVQKGVTNVIITMGAEGCFLYNEEGGRYIPAPKVIAIDTTAAGDVFNGALAVAISEGKSLDEAVVFANAAGAISVTKMGAQASAPYRAELTSTVVA